MRTRSMRWLSAVLAAVILFGSGCAGKTSGEVSEQRLLDAYAKKIDALGYSMDIRETDEPDEDFPEEKVTTCYLEKSGVSYDGLIILDVTRTAAGIKNLNLRMLPLDDQWDFDSFRPLAGALMQACDSSFLQGGGQVNVLADSVAKANDQGAPLERNGKQFHYNLYASSVYFEVEYPKENYALNSKTLAREQGQTLNYLSLSKSAFLEKVRQAYGSLGYSLVKSNLETADPNPRLNPNLSETPKVYQLEHRFGNIAGYLLIYANNQRVYQVAFISPYGTDYFLSFEMASSVLISVCDPTLKGDPIEQESDMYLLYQQIFADDYAENNGLRYEMPVFLDCLTVEAYE